jgi:photosystem II stability/assembly factor-like uncharacterized protein
MRKTALLLAAAVSLAVHAAPGVTDVNPDGDPAEPRYGGRTLGIAIHPFTPGIVYAATERGGFFSSADGGSHWTHIEAIPSPRARDVLFDPRDPRVLIASSRYNGQTVNRGGIWVSSDGGATWLKPPTSNPACSDEASTWNIAIPDDPAAHRNVYVATDCGIAISADSGSTWKHVDPCAKADAAFCKERSSYFDVDARVVGGNVQLDVCGDEGTFRSKDGGATWSKPDPDSPARQVPGGALNPCSVATAPADPDTVYLANYSNGSCRSRLMENAGGGAPGLWTDLNAISANNCRDPFVVTHADPAGDPSLYQVFYSNAVRLRVQRCSLARTPRCNAGTGDWTRADLGAHPDPGDLAFEATTPKRCPRVLSTDGGISTSPDCGATWQDGNRGLHALDMVTLAGTRQPAGRIDLYAGTQDNGIYVSLDKGASWSRPVDFDGYLVMADRTPPVRVFHRVCFNCNDFISNRGINGPVPFRNPPGVMPTFPVAVQFGPRRYVFATMDTASPPNWTAWVTTDEGNVWSQLGPSPLPGRPFEIQAAGPAAAPVFYLRIQASAAPPRMVRLSGPLNATAALTPANGGLRSPAAEWAVDPADPRRLYIVDDIRNSILFSTDGGASWKPDPEITRLITRGGSFRFTSSTFGPLVWGIAFDPGSAKILVGTFTAGIFVSRNNGRSWQPISGSETIAQGTEFFFGAGNDDMYVAARGRGIWRLSIGRRK